MSTRGVLVGHRHGLTAQVYNHVLLSSSRRARRAVPVDNPLTRGGGEPFFDDYICLRGRCCIASAMCTAWMAELSDRSAMVRASLSTRLSRPTNQFLDSIHNALCYQNGSLCLLLRDMRHHAIVAHAVTVSPLASWRCDRARCDRARSHRSPPAWQRAVGLCQAESGTARQQSVVAP